MMILLCFSIYVAFSCNLSHFVLYFFCIPYIALFYRSGGVLFCVYMYQLATKCLRSSTIILKRCA